jgi:hypothetical protein
MRQPPQTPRGDALGGPLSGAEPMTAFDRGCVRSRVEASLSDAVRFAVRFGPAGEKLGRGAGVERVAERRRPLNIIGTPVASVGLIELDGVSEVTDRGGGIVLQGCRYAALETQVVSGGPTLLGQQS